MIPTYYLIEAFIYKLGSHNNVYRQDEFGDWIKANLSTKDIINNGKLCDSKGVLYDNGLGE